MASSATCSSSKKATSGQPSKIHLNVFWYWNFQIEMLAQRYKLCQGLSPWPRPGADQKRKGRFPVRNNPGNNPLGLYLLGSLSRCKVVTLNISPAPSASKTSDNGGMNINKTSFIKKFMGGKLQSMPYTPNWPQRFGS